MKGKNVIKVNPDMKEGMEKDKKKKEEDDGNIDAMKTLKPDASKDDPRSMPTLVNLMKNKLRAKGLNMSFKLNGELVDEMNGSGGGEKDTKQVDAQQKKANQVRRWYCVRKYRQ